MKKKLPILLLSAITGAALVLGAGVACSGDDSVDKLTAYQPNKSEGEGPFDFPSNAFSADVKLDGVLDDERWSGEDVITLGSWDDSDVTSGTYGAVVGDTSNYAGSKRMITKAFRGSVGFHFGFEVRDSDLAYLSLEDGDAAIWTDNVLINLCTSIDGSTIPTSDDYYFIVTAFGNTCFRRGANAAGTWGGWTGVLDFEASKSYAEDGTTVTGFGVELVVPYSQIGLTKNSPLGFTLRSCDRISESNVMIECEWWYNSDVHHFNVPNSYVIWGADNRLYDYYDYQMPAVTVKGTAVDFVTGTALGGITLTDGNATFVTEANGSFEFKDMNANVDLVLSASGESLLAGQTYFVSRDAMRALNGGTLTITPIFLTNENYITQTISGVITSTLDVTGATVKVGENQTAVNADGSYSLEYVFTAPTAVLSVTAAGSEASYELEINVQEAIEGVIKRDIELPVMSKLPDKFGAGADIETYFGWTKNGLFVRFVGTEATNGYGIAYSADGESGKVLLYHSFGTACITDFVSQVWNYAPPESFGLEANQVIDSTGRNIYTIVVPFELLGVSEASDLKIAPFEYTASGPFAFYEDAEGRRYSFGALSALESYPVLKANGSVQFAAAEKVLSTYNVDAFGKSNATAKFEKIDGATDGIRVTITYGAADIWGFGIMLSDGVNGITQLYVPGFGTIDHRVYGNWAWNGNYVAAETLGVQASEKVDGEKKVITLFYSYETFARADYDLDITADTATIGINLFEYVTDGTGSQYGCYNGMKNNEGVEVLVDCGIANFAKWSEKANVVFPVFNTETFGKSNATAKLEKIDGEKSGIRITITYDAADIWGFGIMLSDGVNGITQLYVPGFGTIDHRTYGNWAWNGNYLAPAALGVEATERTEGTKKVITLFYSYATLQRSDYALNISTDSKEIKFNLFEYVTDGTGSQFGCYNGVKKDGVEVLVDCGVQNFISWKANEE